MRARLGRPQRILELGARAARAHTGCSVATGDGFRHIRLQLFGERGPAGLGDLAGDEYVQALRNAIVAEVGAERNESAIKAVRQQLGGGS